jgi:CcmD family protein
MDNGIFLFAAFGITWTIIFAYVFKLFRDQRALGEQIDHIKTTIRRNIRIDGGD